MTKTSALLLRLLAGSRVLIVLHHQCRLLWCVCALAGRDVFVLMPTGEGAVLRRAVHASSSEGAPCLLEGPGTRLSFDRHL